MDAPAFAWCCIFHDKGLLKVLEKRGWVIYTADHEITTRLNTAVKRGKSRERVDCLQNTKEHIS